MESTPELIIGQKILDGQYKVMERIGNGTFGAVYKVCHLKSKIEYAAKVEQFAEEKLE